jgi:hypothetical protein
MTYHVHLEQINGRIGLIAMASIFTGVIVLAVILRFYSRRLMRLPYEADDWLALVALVRPSPISSSISTAERVRYWSSLSMESSSPAPSKAP